MLNNDYYIKEVLSYLKNQKWLIDNNIFPNQLINYLIVLICTIESKVKNVDIKIDANTKSISLIIYIPFLYKLKLNPIFGKLLFFLPSINITSIKEVMSFVFSKWKISIHIR